jgi:hypothetical protein
MIRNAVYVAPKTVAGRAIEWLVTTSPEFPRALCVAEDIDPDLFFPQPTDLWGTLEAKSVCHNCIHRAECAEWAITNNISHGIFGGLTPEERQRAKRRRA